MRTDRTSQQEDRQEISTRGQTGHLNMRTDRTSQHAAHSKTSSICIHILNNVYSVISANMNPVPLYLQRKINCTYLVIDGHANFFCSNDTFILLGRYDSD